jgi:hypothetical protein
LTGSLSDFFATVARDVPLAAVQIALDYLIGSAFLMRRVGTVRPQVIRRLSALRKVWASMLGLALLLSGRLPGKIHKTAASLQSLDKVGPFGFGAGLPDVPVGSRLQLILSSKSSL